MSIRYRAFALLTTIGALSFSPEPVAAQAYCALRDPAPQIHALFPQATRFQSDVGTIDESTRREVGAQLSLPLHTRELGQHTLYIALAGEQRVGIVHVRSEPSDWGLVEVAWAIGMDGRLRDFRLQRCRGDACQAFSSQAARELFRDQDLKAVRALLGADGAALDPTVLQGASESTRRLAAAIARSAAKTLAVTEVVWGRKLRALSAQRQDAT